MKKIAGYEAIKTGAGRPVYVRDVFYKLFTHILKNHRTNYHYMTILRTVMLLNAGGQHGKSLNTAGDSKAIRCGNIYMCYYLHNGAVYIQTLSMMKETAATRTGLYAVSYDANAKEWIPAEDPVESTDITQQWNSDGGKAHYAAIAGRFDGLKTASNKLPKHIIGAYQKANLLTKSGAGKSYSLFWSEKGAHKSQDAAQALASVMQQSTRNGLPVNWLVHGEGVHTFTKAAKILKTSPFASASALAKNPNAGKVHSQNVFFSNPASSQGEATLKRLCEEAGLTYLDTHTNNRDLRRWSTQKNVCLEMGKIASKAVLAGAAGGGAVTAAQNTIGAGGLDKAVVGAFNGLAGGNYLMLAGGVAAAGFALHSAFKRSKVLTAGVKCTFGKGNEEWYTDDGALLS